MAGVNGHLTARGYGSYAVRVRQVGHGLQIITDLDEARTTRALYLRARAVAPFTLMVEFVGLAEHERFTSWMRGYYQRVATAGSGVSAMRVQVPSRGFDQIGIPRSAIESGDQVGQIVYRQAILFEGVYDTRVTTNPLVSTFQQAPGKQESVYFYPAGEQLTGSDVGADLYDNPDRVVTPGGWSTHDIVGEILPPIPTPLRPGTPF